MIKVTHAKFFNVNRFPNKHQVQREHAAIAGFRNMCNHLVKYVAASYADKREDEDHQLTQAMPKWLEADRFCNYGEQLIRVFHISLMVIDHIFGFTAQGNPSGLVPFGKQVFAKIFTMTAQSRFLDNLFRVVPNKESFNKRKHLLELCRANPSQTVGRIQKLAYGLDPEEYRDELVKQLRNAFRQKADLYWVSKLRPKDILLVRWKVLCNRYPKPDDTPLMLIKGKGTKAEQLFQARRHARLRSKYLNVADESEEEDKVKGLQVDDDDDADDEENEDDKECLLTSSAASESSHGPATNPFYFLVNSRETDKNNEEDVEIEETYDEGGDTEAGIVTALGHPEIIQTSTMSIDHLSDPQEVTIPIKVQEHLEVAGAVTLKDMREVSTLLLTYTTADNVAKYIELSQCDILYHRGLDVVPHKVVSKEVELNNLNFSTKTGHMWIPSKLTTFCFEYGVIRSDHDILHSKLKVLDEVKLDIILAYLFKHGKKDGARDTSPVRVHRVNIGAANHNYACRTGDRAPFAQFRDKPRHLCGVDDIKSFVLDGKPSGKILAKSIATILDLIQSVIDEAYETRNLPLPLNNAFQYYVFTQHLNKALGCSRSRFPGLNMGVAKIEKENTTTVTEHTDNNNGIQPGNDISATFSMFFKGRDPDNGVIALYRFWVIPFTRKSTEDYEANEALLSDMKQDVKNFRDRIDHSYGEFWSRGGDDKVTFASPHNIWLSSELSWETNVLNETKYESIDVATSYCREISASSGLTILRRCYVKVGNAKKMMELLLVALYCGAWTKFYLAGLVLLDSEETSWDGNLAVQLVSMMNSMFGDWRGGSYHRGRTTKVDFISTFSDPKVLTMAVDAMYDFLTDLESHDLNLSLPEFKEKVNKMITHIPGIGLFYGQNLALYSACTGIVLKKNARYGTYAFPVTSMGSEKEINHQNCMQEKVLAADGDDTESDIDLSTTLDDLRLGSSSEQFMKTTRLFCQYCDLETARPNWAECGLCDGLHRTTVYFDTLHRYQSMFWLFDDPESTACVAKEKVCGTQYWVPLRDLEP